MKRLLVCALDWGLGHATRTIPVVRELTNRGAEVILCSSGSAGTILKEEFPSLGYHELPGYSPVYQRGSSSMFLTLARQGPRIHRVIQKENEAIAELMKKYRPDAILSDNRYGCFHPSVPSVLITHQITLRLPSAWNVLSPLTNRWLRTHYRNFNYVWVPDQPGSVFTKPFLSNKVPHRFIGWLSRFKATGDAQDRDLVAVISGPEPQRSSLEEILRAQLSRYQGKSLLVLGKPGDSGEQMIGNCEVVNHLPASKLESALRGAGLVISRGGYSTIMDLIALQKHAVFVPTPQQTEQLYLASILKHQGIAYSMHQEDFSLDEAISEARRYSGLGVFKGDDSFLPKQLNQLLS